MAGKLESTLAEQLPEADASHLQELVSLLTNHDNTPHTAQKTVQSLLDDGCSPHSLHAALLYGRNLSLQQMSANELIRGTLLYYDRLVAILMQLAMRQLKSRLNRAETSLMHEGQRHLLTKARNRWLKAGSLELYNYFMEVPIITRVALLESRDDGITIKRTEDVIWTITAGEYGRYVMTRIPGSEFSLRMEVQNTTGHKIHLKDAGVLPIAKERRSHIRVLNEKAIPIRITLPGHGETDAMVQDYSEAGLGIITRLPIEPREKDKIVQIFLNLHGMEIDVDARVCWVRHDEQTRLGLDMELSGDPHIRQYLQRQVALARKTVMSKLHMQGLPECLMPSL